MISSSSSSAPFHLPGVELGVWSARFGVWDVEFGAWVLEIGVRDSEFMKCKGSKETELFRQTIDSGVEVQPHP